MTGGTKYIIDCIMIAESGINLIFCKKIVLSLKKTLNMDFGCTIVTEISLNGFQFMYF